MLMNKKIMLLVSILMLIPLPVLWAVDSAHKSKYAGEEKRAIKSLSESDIAELKSGQGWGLAKAAELNGMPGPVHLLDMKVEIGLSPKQIQAIEELYSIMKHAAIPLGIKLIELERELNNHFANRTITDGLLHQLLERISDIRRQLRYVHLSAHLKTPAILTSEQIARYNQLRGTPLPIPAKMCPQDMIQTCGKSITIVPKWSAISS